MSTLTFERKRFLKTSLLLMECTDHHLKLAKQIGVTDIVLSYGSAELEYLLEQKKKINSFGMEFSVVERLLPHDKIVHGKPGRDEQIENIKTLLKNMGKAGIKTLCYNWMPADDWTRTTTTTPGRGGALVTTWKLGAKPASALANENGRASHDDDGATTSCDDLWANLKHFLSEVIPVAEEAGVVLALHPDDPPVENLNGKAQILYSVEQLKKAVDLYPSDANGICYCQGSLASAGEEVVDGIATLAKHIKYIHFRDVVGSVKTGGFEECFQDNGPTDMVAAMKSYHKNGVANIPIRPDHVPTLDGEANQHPGYEMLGRLWAVGYINGLIDAVAH